MKSSTLQLMNDWCEFGEDRAYLLMAIARSKENENINSSEEIVFREVIKNQRDIERKYDKLRNACNNYSGTSNWRVYLTVNARDVVSAFNTFQGIQHNWIKQLMEGNEQVKEHFKRIDSKWKSELQKPVNKDETYFIFDLDEQEFDRLEELKRKLEGVRKYIVRKTPNGWHVVTDTFNYTELELDDFDLEIKKDGLLNLEKWNFERGGESYDVV